MTRFYSISFKFGILLLLVSLSLKISAQEEDNKEVESTTRSTVEKFYHAFSNKDIDGMLACYSDDVVFHDPGFGKLEGDRAKAMWHMLVTGEESDLSVTYKVIEDTDHQGIVDWEAKYLFGPSNRKVHNKIKATLELENGKIVKHTDRFNFWKWNKMALGPVGHLIGWMPFMKPLVQKKTNQILDDYMKENRWSN